jgi:hypothetical protein
MFKTHGMSSSPHFRRWRNMMGRCYDPTDDAYKNYGGRGIKVCDRWHDVRNFISELPDGYQRGLEIDRINNDGNYEPGNVKWSTRVENCTNRRTARKITFDGRIQTLSQWGEEKGLARATLVYRLDYLNWSIERALTEPAAGSAENMRRIQSLRWAGHTKKAAPKPLVIKTFMFNGRLQTIREISQYTGIPIELLRKRLCERNWPIDKATRDGRRLV